MLHQQIPQIFTLIRFYVDSQTHLLNIAKAILESVPLNNELLNLWNDFRFIVEYLKSVEGIIKLIESI